MCPNIPVGFVTLKLSTVTNWSLNAPINGLVSQIGKKVIPDVQSQEVAEVVPVSGQHPGKLVVPDIQSA